MRSLFHRKSGERTRIVSDRLIDAVVFPHVCSLWMPEPLTHKSNLTRAATDPVYTLANPAQICQFIATPETDVPKVVTRTKEVNIFTLDKFLFPPGVVVEDTWVIKLTSANLDYSGRFWMVQGNPQGQEQFFAHVVEVQMCYAKLCVSPTGVS